MTEPVETEKLGTLTHCPSCASRIGGKYCSECGQRHRYDMPTAKQLFREILQELLGVDSKLWRTLRVLLNHPGQLTQDDWQGKRSPYFKPLSLYLFCSFLLFSLFFVFTPDISDSFRGFEQGFIHGSTKPLKENEKQAALTAAASTSAPTGLESGFLLQGLSMVSFLGLPLLAVWLRRFFRDVDKPYGAHFIFALHLQSAAILIMMAILPLALAVPEPYSYSLFALIPLAIYIYFIAAARRVYQISWWRSGLKVFFISLWHTFSLCFALSIYLIFLFMKLEINK